MTAPLVTAHGYGLQVDLDLGNYERFLDITLTRDNNITTGKIYQVRRPCRLQLGPAWGSGSGVWGGEALQLDALAWQLVDKRRGGWHVVMIGVSFWFGSQWYA